MKNSLWICLSIVLLFACHRQTVSQQEYAPRAIILFTGGQSPEYQSQRQSEHDADCTLNLDETGALRVIAQ